MTQRPSPSLQFRISTGLGILALVLAIATAVQAMRNRSLQDEVVTAQSQVAKAQTLANVDNSLVQLMAKTAVDNNDTALRDLLARNGVTFKANAPAAPTAQPETEKK